MSFEQDIRVRDLMRLLVDYGVNKDQQSWEQEKRDAFGIYLMACSLSLQGLLPLEIRRNARCYLEGLPENDELRENYDPSQIECDW